MRRICLGVTGLMLYGSTVGYATDLGTYGPVFEIVEENLLDLMMQRLKALEETGEMAHHQKILQERIKDQVRHPKPVTRLTKATRYVRMRYDPSFVVQEDITDLQGNIIAQKGDYHNPLDHVSFGDPLIIIDGTDEEQVTWALKQPGKIVLVNGAPLDLAEEHERHFYFDQGGILTEKLKVQEVPTTVRQEWKHLVIETIPMDKGGRS